jgi:hypothetical protein
MKACGGVDIYIHIFFASALAGVELLASCPDRFTSGERAPVTHWIGGWVGPRTGLDDVERKKFLTLQELKLRPLGRSARSQSLHGLRYPGVVPVPYLSDFSLQTPRGFQNLFAAIRGRDDYGAGLSSNTSVFPRQQKKQN